MLISMLGPLPVMATGGNSEEGADLTTAIAKAVAWYQEQHPAPDNWEGLPALWGAGENLNEEPWLAAQGWRETDPGFAADTTANDHLYYIFRLLAVGKNPANIWGGRNLFAELAAQQTEAGVFDNLGKHLWAMVVLDIGKELGENVGCWDEDNRQKALDYLLSQQNQDGSFGPFSQLDYTGWSLTALSNYRGDPNVEATISKAIDYLSSKQQDNAGFDMGGIWGEENSNSNAAVLSGLVAVGENLLAPEGNWVKGGTTILDALLKYQQEDGSFWYKENTAGAIKASTVQCLMALVDLKHGESTRSRMGREIQFAQDPEHETVAVWLTVEGKTGTIFTAAEVEVSSAIGAPTALDLLEQGLTVAGIPYDLQHYDWGVLVGSIAGEENGVLGGWDGWTYTVNGVSPDVGAADYMVEEGDAVLFYYSRWPAIATTAVIEPGDENPGVEIDLVGDEYAALVSAEDPENWVIDAGETGLTLGGITKEENQKVTVAFTGTAAAGTISIQARAAALEGDADSDELILEITTNAEKRVAEIKANLDLGDLSAVTENLTLPITRDEATITWATSNPSIINENGKVTRPTAGQGNATVTLTATITIGDACDTKEFIVTVKAATSSGSSGGEGNITVTFKLTGDNNQTWIPSASVTIAQGSTVFDVFDKILREKGLDYEKTGENYINGIKAPASFGGSWLRELDNGPYSGWMYSINGEHTLLGSYEYRLINGDLVAWYYTNDFTKEEGSEKWNSGSGGGAGGGSPTQTTPQPAITDETVLQEIIQKPEEENEMLFTDLQGYEWAKEAIKTLAARGVISGRGEGIFDPGASITRAESVSLVTRLLGYNGTVAELPFTDVLPNNWYYGAVAQAYHHGLLGGRSATEFDPSSPITRQEIALVISKMIKTGKADQIVAVVKGLEVFNDKGEIAEWAREGVSLCVDRGIIAGMGDGTFAPLQNANRAQAAVMLYRFSLL